MAATAAAIIAVVVLYFSQANLIAGRRPHVGGAANLPAQFLGPHNVARATVGLRPLVWDARLAGYAAMYASRRRRDCALVHSDGPYGENIFWGGGTGWTAAEAVAAWVAERRWYRHADNTCARGEECGHYTQIIWADTRRMGCAAVTCVAERGVFIMCNYDPPGNYIGEKPY